MIAIVFGLPGVGKSSIVTAIVDQLKFEHLHWGNLTKEIGIKKGLIKEIDEMRRFVDINKQKAIQKEIADYIEQTIKSNPDKNFLIETHAILKTGQGYWAGTPENILKQLNPEMLLMITATPEEIMKRRNIDTSRNRSDDSDIEEVKQSIDLSNAYCATYSSLIGSPLYVLHNKEGKIEEAITEGVNVIKQYLD